MSSTPAAIKMRRWRNRRRRDGFCIVLEVYGRDVQALVRAGHLDRLQAGELPAIEAALGKVLDGLADRYR